MKLARAVEPYPDLVERVERGEVSGKDAMRIVRERDAEQRRAVAQPPAVTKLGSGVEIRLGRFQDVLKDTEDDSVALILTDPPWEWGSTGLFDELGSYAARVLRRGGVLVVYIGAGDFAGPIQALSVHGLKGFLLGGQVNAGAKTQLFPIKAHVGFTPILYFSKGEYTPRRWLHSPVLSDKPEKDHHPWQQNISGFLDHVEVFSEPGDLVVDPFLGGGTSAVAAARLGRQFVGCDSDPLAVESTLERLGAERAE